MPVCGIVVIPREVRNSIVAPAGDHPLALRPWMVPVEMSCTMANSAVHHRRHDPHDRIGRNRRVARMTADREHNGAGPREASIS